MSYEMTNLPFGDDSFAPVPFLRGPSTGFHPHLSDRPTGSTWRLLFDANSGLTNLNLIVSGSKSTPDEQSTYETCSYVEWVVECFFVWVFCFGGFLNTLGLKRKASFIFILGLRPV